MVMQNTSIENFTSGSTSENFSGTSGLTQIEPDVEIFQ